MRNQLLWVVLVSVGWVGAADAVCAIDDGAHCYAKLLSDFALTHPGSGPTTFAERYPCDGAALGKCSSSTGPYVYVNASQDNFVYMPVPPSPKLLLFLAGGGTAPAKYRDFMEEAAVQGYRVIGLVYDNPNNRVPNICKPDYNPPAEAVYPGGTVEQQNACLTELDSEKAFGTWNAASMPAAIAPDGWNYGNGVVQRLTLMLQHLDAANSGDGWAQFLTTDADGQAFPDWSKIRLSAHSQGTKPVTLIAQRHNVHRVIMFGGNGDNIANAGAPDTTPDYIIPHGATSAFAMFSFDLADSFSQPDTVINWETDGVRGLGLPFTSPDVFDYDPLTKSQDVDRLALGQLSGHRFTTKPGTSLNCLTDPSNPGSSTAAHWEGSEDCSMKHFIQVWDYMLTAPVPVANQPPTVAAPASISVPDSGASPLLGFAFSDPDAQAASLTVTFTVDSGALTATGTDAVGVSVSDTSLPQTSLTLNASIAALNAFVAAGGVSWAPAADMTGATLTVTINDGGYTGFGGALTAMAMVTLNVTEPTATGTPPATGTTGTTGEETTPPAEDAPVETSTVTGGVSAPKAGCSATGDRGWPFALLLFLCARRLRRLRGCPYWIPRGFP